MNIIGTIYNQTGKMLKDDEGNEYPETSPIEGWHVNSPVKIEAFAKFELTGEKIPSTPMRVYAGKDATTIFYTFPDEETFKSLLPETEQIG